MLALHAREVPYREKLEMHGARLPWKELERALLRLLVEGSHIAKVNLCPGRCSMSTLCMLCFHVLIINALLNLLHLSVLGDQAQILVQIFLRDQPNRYNGLCQNISVGLWKSRYSNASQSRATAV